MTVIRINQLKLTVGSRDLLDIKNLQVQADKRIAIVGKNGSGKSTLFKILAGEIEADIANFSVNGTIAMLPQMKPTTTNKSGGEISQEYIVHVLKQVPRILLADEPTTNLDTSHIEWVEKS